MKLLSFLFVNIIINSLCSILNSSKSYGIFHTIRVYGNSSVLHYYFADIYVGSKFKKQSLIIDTGSSLLGFPCKSFCKKCGVHSNPYYDHKESNTSAVLNCQDAAVLKLKCDYCNNDNMCSYHQSYGEGSAYSGVFIQDKISFGVNFNKSVLIPFGCHSKETNLFVSQNADGVLGLSPKEQRFSSLINHLLKNSIINNKIFSLCLGNNGGSFTLGGVNNSLHKKNQEIDYIDYKADELYKIMLKTMHIGELHFNIKVYAALDTGSTNTFFPKQIFDMFFLKLKEICSSPIYCIGDILKINDEICFYIQKTVSQKSFYYSMPNIVFIFEKMRYEWKPESYLHNKDGKNEYCLNIMRWESDEIMLGSSWMHNHDIIFDLESKKIGLIKAKCSSIQGNNLEGGRKHLFTQDECCDYAHYYILFIFLFLFVLIGVIIILCISILNQGNKESNLILNSYSEESSQFFKEVRKSQHEIDKIMSEIQSLD